MKFFSVIAAAVAEATTASTTVSTKLNPIRRVVTLLENLQKKIQEEGEKEQELYKKMQCYCKNSRNDLEASIAEREQAAPQLKSEIEASISAKSQLDEELAQHKEDRKAAKQAMTKATKIRAEEKAEFDKVSAEFKANIKSLESAVSALSKGMGHGFLQTSLSSIKKILNKNITLEGYQRAELTEFLSTNNAPSGGTNEIIGILKQMLEDMKEDAGGIFEREEAAVKAFNGMIAAKTKEVNAHTKAIEHKTARSGQLAVEIVNKKNDSEDVLEALDEDKKFLAELDSSCGNKDQEFSERQKLRSEELAAVSEVIEMLSHDDSLDLFNKTLKKPKAFLQLDTPVVDLRKQALDMIQVPTKLTKVTSTNLNFLALALKGKKVGFEKILKMIDDMVVTLKQEQVDDEEHKEYCLSEFDSADDKQKELTRHVENTTTGIEESKDAISQLTSEIKSLKIGIKELDKSVAEATETRKEENEEFVELIRNNGMAKDLILFAKNRLNQFYNPALATTTTGAPLTEEERLFVANGGELSTTPAPAGIAGTGIGAFVQVNAHTQEKPGDMPETWSGEYQSKGQESNGVIAMMDMLVKELETETQAAEHEEKTSQRDYTQLMADAKDKREADTKSITEKTSAKADGEANLEALEASLRSGKAELLATHEYIQNLHTECDFLLKNFDLRKDARSQEIDGLKNAKAVLSGADFGAEN